MHKLPRICTNSVHTDKIFPVLCLWFYLSSGKLSATAKKRGKAAPKTKPVQIADLATTRCVCVCIRVGAGYALACACVHFDYILLQSVVYLYIYIYIISIYIYM